MRKAGGEEAHRSAGRADFRSSNASWVLVFQDKDLGLVKTSKGQYVG